MLQSKKAYQFAQALFSVSEKQGKTSEVLDSLEQLVHLYRRNAQFRFVLLSKRIPRDKKIQIVRAALNGKVLAIALEMMEILFERDAVIHLAEITDKFSRLESEINDFAQVVVELSNELQVDEMENLKQDLELNLKKEINLEVIVNPHLIGGMVLRVDNMIVDGSLRTQLNKVRNHLILN